MINEQAEETVVNLLIEDSKRLLGLVIERHFLYNSLTRTTSPPLQDIQIKHQALSKQQNSLTERYKHINIHYPRRLKSFLIRFHCRLEEMLLKAGADIDFIKYSALENFKVLREAEITGEAIIKSLLLHPKVEIQKILTQKIRNRSMIQVRSLSTEPLKRHHLSSVLPENRQLLMELSKSSKNQYREMDINPRDMYCFLESRQYNQDNLLLEIIERNKSVSNTIKIYRKQHKQKRIRNPRKNFTIKEISMPKTIKQQTPKTVSKRTPFVMGSTPKPLCEFINRSTLVF